jgi:hypothetical protein
MSLAAIVMMIIAITVVWGGLAAAIVSTIRHSEPGPPKT